MACCTNNCNQNVVTIGYLKEIIQGKIQNQDGTQYTISTSLDDSYCPTYGELTNGSIIRLHVQATDASDDVDGFEIRVQCTAIGGNYALNQVVNKEDVIIKWTRFDSTSISSSKNQVSPCGEDATLSYSSTYKRNTSEFGSSCSISSSSVNSVSSSDGNTTFSITSSPSYGSINGNTYSIDKNTSGALRSDTISGQTTFRGSVNGSTNSITISQNKEGEPSSAEITTYKVTTAFAGSATTPTSFVDCGAVTYGVQFNRDYDIYKVIGYSASCDSSDTWTETVKVGSSAETVTSITKTFEAVSCLDNPQSDTISYEYTDPVCGNSYTDAITFTRDCDTPCACQEYTYTYDAPPNVYNMDACGRHGRFHFNVQKKCVSPDEDPIELNDYTIDWTLEMGTDFVTFNRENYSWSDNCYESPIGSIYRYELHTDDPIYDAAHASELSGHTTFNQLAGPCSSCACLRYDYTYTTPSNVSDISNCEGSSSIDFNVRRRCASPQGEYEAYSNYSVSWTFVSGDDIITFNGTTYTWGDNCTQASKSGTYRYVIDVNDTDYTTVLSGNVIFSQVVGPCSTCDCLSYEYTHTNPSDVTNLSNCTNSSTLDFDVKKRCASPQSAYQTYTNYSVSWVHASGDDFITFNTNSGKTYTWADNCGETAKSGTYNYTIDVHESGTYTGSLTGSMTFSQVVGPCSSCDCLRHEYTHTNPSDVNNLSNCTDSSSFNFNVQRKCASPETSYEAYNNYTVSWTYVSGDTFVTPNNTAYTWDNNCTESAKRETYNYTINVNDSGTYSGDLSGTVTFNQAVGPCSTCGCLYYDYSFEPITVISNLNNCSGSSTFDFGVERWCASPEGAHSAYNNYSVSWTYVSGDNFVTPNNTAYTWVKNCDSTTKSGIYRYVINVNDPDFTTVLSGNTTFNQLVGPCSECCNCDALSITSSTAVTVAESGETSMTFANYQQTSCVIGNATATTDVNWISDLGLHTVGRDISVSGNVISQACGAAQRIGHVTLTYNINGGSEPCVKQIQVTQEPSTAVCCDCSNVLIDPSNGYDYVEIGGIKWATMNIGANSVTDTGLYFQWADTQGYTANQVGSGSGKKYFGWDDYKYCIDASESYSAMTKYYENDVYRTITASDDAANANWGGAWRMPSNDDFRTLTAASNTAWTQVDGVYGMQFTDKTDSSKTLFFPSVGYANNGSINSLGSNGSYWLNDVSYQNSKYITATIISFNQYYTGNSPFNRNNGLPIRPILDVRQNNNP